MARLDSHENATRSETLKSGSDRAFGLVFAVLFTVIGLWPLIDGGPLRWWSIIMAAALVVISTTFPQILAPFNRVWFLFGLLLHKIVSPLVMGMLFYLTVTPTALIMRILGKCPLALSFDKEASSYWIKRDPPGPEPKTMERQF